MTKFCNTHIVDRTKTELEARLNNLNNRNRKLGPGLEQERERIIRELSKRNANKEGDNDSQAVQDRTGQPPHE